jgi:arylsulfatase A-like enzyme
MAFPVRSKRAFQVMLVMAVVAGMVYFWGRAQAGKPNFVFILVDDLGWTDLGCYGSTFHETPNLDRLAASGMRFTDAYSASPVCSPTRAAIMTGKHPARLRITDWIPGQDPKDRRLLGPRDLHQLPLDETTIAETLREKGYQTFFAGKWHLGGEGFYPEDQGFDINLGGHEKGSPPGGYYTPYANPKLKDGKEGEYLTDRLTEESIRFLESARDQPFFLFLSFYTVHTPIQACLRHVEKFQARAEGLSEAQGPAQIVEHDGYTKQRQDNPDYASMVHAMDENVGRLLDRLEELGLSPDTVVIFTSDNGGLSTLYRVGSPTSNLPLRAGKGWCYEGGIRVPLLIRAPGTTTPGTTSAVPVIATDYFPTILELAGFELMPDQHLDGKSLLPLLTGGGALERDAVFWHFPHYHGSAWTPGAAVRKGNWKLIEFFDKRKVELYDLGEDVGERVELSQKFPDKKAELLARLQDWQESLQAQMPEPNPGYDTNRKEE